MLLALVAPAALVVPAAPAALVAPATPEALGACGACVAPAAPARLATKGPDFFLAKRIDACAFLPKFCKREWEDLRLRASLNRGAHNERPPKLLFSGCHFSIYFV